MLVALFIFLLNQGIFSGRGFMAKYEKKRPEAIKRSRLTGICWLIISLPIFALLFHFAIFAHILLLILGVLAIIFIVYSF